jgi:hypothetical protein
VKTRAGKSAAMVSSQALVGQIATVFKATANPVVKNLLMNYFGFIYI